MAWVPAEEYKALIGGILYRDVPQPVVCNGSSLISLTRNTESGELAVSLDVTPENNRTIASVRHNVITLRDTADFTIRKGLHRCTSSKDFGLRAA
jgi:hypothetical protein